MCWPENDASEKNKARTGELSKSISCAASKTIPAFAQASKARCPGQRCEVPRANWVYSLPLYSRLAMNLIIASIGSIQ